MPPSLSMTLASTPDQTPPPAATRTPRREPTKRTPRDPTSVSSSASEANLRATLDACYAGLEGIRLPNGLYLASPSADYSKVWLRDTVYEVLPYVDKATHHYEQTYHSLLDILRRHEWKIDAMIQKKSTHRDDYIHARFHPETLTEFHEPWGNKQNDATGAILFGIAEGLRHGKRVLRDERDARVVQKLIHMLDSLRYWEDPDNGMWEEYEELHASSIGACLGGLLAIGAQGFDVPQHLVEQGRHALDHLLPRETVTRRTDLALMSLIWPYRVTSAEQTKCILQDVESRLLRKRGVIRYEGDSYYSTRAEEHGRDKPFAFYHGSEAEWTFGLPWLSLCWREVGDVARSVGYVERSLGIQLDPGILPELYYADTDEPNPNTPLGWSQAMLIQAIEAQLRT